MSYQTLLILIQQLSSMYLNKSIKIKITIEIVTTVEIFINLFGLRLFLYGIIYHLIIY